MKKIILLILITVFTFTISYNSSFAERNYFLEGKKLFENKKYKDAKFIFEKDIVFNPKNENSYLYLAKIFNKENNLILEENNLKTVILLNPKNENAIYYLALLNIKNSNFLKAKELASRLEKVCINRCTSIKNLENKLENLLNK
jgi:tetratricopeptide (TPR) repeat protein